MRKIVFFGFMASVLIYTGAALADSATLTTQDYVDGGLRALYRTIDGKKADTTKVYTKEEADGKFLTEHQDVSGKADAATTLSGYGITDAYTKSEVDTKVANIVAGDMTEALSGKQDAIEDLTTIRSGAAAGATAVQPAALNDYALKTSIPSKTSDLTNDSGYLTAHQDISGKADKTEIPSKTSELTNDSGYITETALNDYLTTANAETAYQPKGTYVENPTLPDTSGNFVLVVNRDDNNNYTYSWKSAGDSGGGSGGDDDWFDDSDW